jgi:MFS family permease
MAERVEDPKAKVSQAALEIDSNGSANINEAALVRKLDLRLLPSVTVLYLLSFLDRSNVGNARLEGLTKDLHMTGNQYLTGLTLFFIGYVLFEIPANIVLKRTSPRLWLPTLTLFWGIVATLMGVTQNMAGFFVVRFFLGVTEAGLFPGVVYYLSMWYKRKERQYRIGLFFSAASLAGAFGGILAWAVAKMKGVGHLDGWRWIFILEGILTVLVSLAAYFFIVNYPNTAKFITNDERDLIQARLKADSDATRHEVFDWANVSSALLDVKCWLYGLAFHTMSLPLYTLSLFLVSINSSNPLITRLQSLAHNHSKSRVYSGRRSTHDNSTIRHRYSPDGFLGLGLRTHTSPRPMGPRLLLRRNNRLHHPTH